MRQTIIGFTLLLLFTPLLSYGASSVFEENETEKRWYWGMHLGSIKTDLEEDLHAGMLVFGRDLSNVFSVEAHLGKTNTVDDGAFTASWQYIGAAFARANLRYEKVNWYLLGGYGTAKAEVKLNGQTFSEDTITGPAYGAGVEIFGGPHTALTISYIRYVDDDSGDVQGEIKSTNIGFVYHFDWLPDSPRY